MSKIVFGNSNTEINSYSINLLWLNKTKDYNQEFIYPSEYWKTKILNAATKWAEANPSSSINILIDSDMHDQKSISKTEEVFKNKFQNIKGSNIILKDVRDIVVVKENPILFNEDMDLYFRIDLLKLIICWHQLKFESLDSTIFSDLEVGDLRNDQLRMNKAELFDHESMKNLEKFGMLNNFGNYTDRENQFIQILNNELSVLSLKTMINVCLMRGIDNLNAPFEKQEKLLKNLPKAPFYATVFEFSKYYMGMKTGSIEVKSEVVDDTSGNEFVKFDLLKHGYAPFGNVFYSGNYCFDFEDFSKLPSFLVKEPIRFGLRNSDISGGHRETNTRDGNDHHSYPKLPDKNHPKFIYHFINDEDIHEIENDINSLGLSNDLTNNDV